MEQCEHFRNNSFFPGPCNVLRFVAAWLRCPLYRPVSVSCVFGPDFLSRRTVCLYVLLLQIIACTAPHYLSIASVSTGRNSYQHIGNLCSVVCFFIW